MDKLVKVVETLNAEWVEFKKEHSKSLEGKADVLLTEKVDRMNEGLTALTEAQEGLVAQEAMGDLVKTVNDIKERVYSPEFSQGNTKEQDEHVEKFTAFMRKSNAVTEAALDEFDAKAVTIGTNADGGHAVPAPIAAEILKKILDISPITAAVRNTPVTSPLYERLVDTLGTASGWAGETDSRSDTATATLQQVTFTHGELYALPKASNWSLNDLMFNVESWLSDNVAKEFAYQLGAAVTVGDGTNKPTGFIGVPVVGADDNASPTRPFGTIQYLPTGAAADFQGDRLSSPQGDPWAVFIDLMTAFKPEYLANASFSFNRATQAILRKLRDVDGNYYWAPSVIQGMPNTLWGYDVIPNENHASVGANAFPVSFGDFREGYELISIAGMNVIRDALTVKGHTLFYTAQRFGGKLVNDDAIKVIKCATS